MIRPPITRQVMRAFTERACAWVWPRTRWRDTVSALCSTSVLGPSSRNTILTVITIFFSSHPLPGRGLFANHERGDFKSML